MSATDFIQTPPPAETQIPFDNSFERDLPGMYIKVSAAHSPAPEMLLFNRALADELNLIHLATDPGKLTAIFSGNELPAGAASIAQAYSGHQFGGFSPQLGDGRALLLGEVIDRNGYRRDISFKGSGRTPYSRGGDGKATLGPVLREYIMGEAMHALGIPTTRVLAAVRTGQSVLREHLLPGAILTRVASSHLRVGSFQYAAARGDRDLLRSLADYAIKRHDPELLELPGEGKGNRYLALLSAVSERQAKLVAQWLSVGFIHGVMNTDNMTISGETIDYGPCAFMDRYDPATVFSSIDLHGRYAYANQAPIAQWNLARLAEALLLLSPSEESQNEQMFDEARSIIEAFPARHQRHWLTIMRAKLGLPTEKPEDLNLAQGFLAAMENQAVDFTSAFVALGQIVNDRFSATAIAALRALFTSSTALDQWLISWQERCNADDSQFGAPKALAERLALMQKSNPIYIARNHLVEEALTAAVTSNDMRPFEKLLGLLQRPYTTNTENQAYRHPPTPQDAYGYQTYCGT